MIRATPRGDGAIARRARNTTFACAPATLRVSRSSREKERTERPLPAIDVRGWPSNSLLRAESVDRTGPLDVTRRAVLDQRAADGGVNVESSIASRSSDSDAPGTNPDGVDAEVLAVGSLHRDVRLRCRTVTRTTEKPGRTSASAGRSTASRSS